MKALVALNFLAVAVLGLTDTAVAVSGDATYYHVSAGLTACGTRHSDSEMVAAIGFPYWTTPNPNLDPNCRKTAWVRDPTNGNTITVRIVDKCGSCDRNNIDLSPAAFQRFRPLGVGRFRVEWGIN